MGAQGDLTTYNIRRLFANVGEGKSCSRTSLPLVDGLARVRLRVMRGWIRERRMQLCI